MRLLGVTEFINEINIEKLALTQPYCCRNIEGECKHEAKQVTLKTQTKSEWNQFLQKQTEHRNQIRCSLIKEHEESIKRKAAREEEDFKNRINPGGVYMAHRDSDGKPI